MKGKTMCRAFASALVLALLGTTSALAQEEPTAVGEAAAPEGAASAEADLERARMEAEKARAEADKARAEADKARAEAERARAEAETAQAVPVEDVQGEPVQRRNFNLTINPLGLLLGGISAGFIVGLGDVVSIGLRGIYLAPLNVDFSGFGGEFSLLFWTEHPNDGFFIGPFVQVVKTHPESDEYYSGILTVAPGGEVGYRWLWNGGFNLGLGGGLGYPINVAQDKECPEDYICTETTTSPLFLLFDLGYAF
jgi:hypothetical protein